MSHGQSATEVTPESVAQMEQTYRAELRRIHLPLISAYIADLQRLAAESRSSQVSVAIDGELKTMQRIIGEGGVISLRNARRITTDPSSDAPMPESDSPIPVAGTSKILLSLTPALATTIEPAINDATLIEAAPVFKISWRIEALPAGAYEIALQYAYPVTVDDLKLQLDMGRNEIEIPLAGNRTTQTAEDFRLVRIGRIDLPVDVKNETLSLSILSGSATPLSSPPLLVRQVLVAREKPPP